MSDFLDNLYRAPDVAEIIMRIKLRGFRTL
jgi:hypothetical protein